MFAENLAPFFATTDFAQDAVFTFGTGTGATTSTAAVIFDAAYRSPFGEFEGTAPVAWLPTASAPSVQQGDALAVESVPYSIVEVMPDGSGKVLQLRLRRSS